MSDLSVYEAGLREEGDVRAQSVLYSCRQCERPLRHLGYDGLCDPCAGMGEAEDAARKREARRRLHRDTAFLLRRLGFPERAAWHDTEAER